ncbi:signal transduction histidine kinase [Oxalobacteraceae bacterium GrIS 1.18]
MNLLRTKIHTAFSNDLERSRTTMQWGGLLGTIAHPIYYFIWTYLLPQPYDNLLLRLSAAVFCIPPVFQKYWPKRFELGLILSWHFCLIYALPFVCTFLAIKNSFSTMWMMTEVMMIFIMALCINVPLLLMIYVSAGISAAFLAVIATSENPLILSNADKSNLALLPVVLLCSMVFSNTMQKGRILAEKTKALISLAGTIAHEMRNPLEQMKYAMNNIAQVLPIPSTCDLDQTITAGTINQIFSHIEHGLTSCDRGLQVIDMTLREVSNQTLDPAKLSYYSALSLTETALEEYEFESPIERDRVKLQVKSDFIFKVDETAYIYIIFNLLKNALYYFSSYPDARITITIERQKITVTDSGPGISKRVLANIFKNFATDGKPNGTGPEFFKLVVA